MRPFASQMVLLSSDAGEGNAKEPAKREENEEEPDEESAFLPSSTAEAESSSGGKTRKTRLRPAVSDSSSPFLSRRAGKKKASPPRKDSSSVQVKPVAIEETSDCLAAVATFLVLCPEVVTSSSEGTGGRTGTLGFASVLTWTDAGVQRENALEERETKL